MDDERSRAGIKVQRQAALQYSICKKLDTSVLTTTFVSPPFLALFSLAIHTNIMHGIHMACLTMVGMGKRASARTSECAYV
jgi:hypothetical protein